jgi:uncharacterized membrane protein YcaP (DUF421 family)
METVIRASIMFAFIWLVMRVIGKKELSGMSSFELVLLVVIGDLIQQGVTQQDTSMTAAILAVSTVSLLVVITSYISFRFRRASRVTEGMPVVIVRNGRVQQQLIRMERLTEDEVREAAREQGIADVRGVAVGILETDGKFSFVKMVDVDQQQGEQEPPAA